MVQLGFVIDQTRCIGCHACTVACKSENHVPVGSFRTWVKYTEEGEFPKVKRSFAVLRCNQCTDAPCMTICPTSALFKRSDGIVDLDGDACIGCKSCMQGCPYDALYINEDSGTAEKCHFCAHRTDVGLAPACAVVCPTEAIIPGDFDDPASPVSRLRAGGRLTARKEEAGTGPNVLYREARQAGLDPLSTSSAGGYLWANQRPGEPLEAERFRAQVEQVPARTTYDVDHQPLWGWRVSGYLFTKSISAGVILATAPLLWNQGSGAGPTAAALTALVFLGITTVLLVADLKRPDRFLYILKRPNWSSWLVRGTAILIAFSLFTTALGALSIFGGLPVGGGAGLLWGLAALAAAGTACYTGFLFAQAKGRVLWMQRGLWFHLIVQALVAGAAASIIGAAIGGAGTEWIGSMRNILLQGLFVHALFQALAAHLAPHGREREYHRAHELISRGPYARQHWLVGIGAGIVVPALLLLVPGAPAVWSVASLLVLAGLWAEEDAYVRAGQALPIS